VANRIGLLEGGTSEHEHWEAALHLCIVVQQPSSANKFSANKTVKMKPVRREIFFA
jgi:hypothetical protein